MEGRMGLMEYYTQPGYYRQAYSGISIQCKTDQHTNWMTFWFFGLLLKNGRVFIISLTPTKCELNPYMICQ